MDVRNTQLHSDPWAKASSSTELLDEFCQDRHHLFSNYDSQQQQQRENSSILDYDVMIRKKLETIPPSLTQIKLIQEDIDTKIKPQLWDPKTMLTNLSIMEDKIHQLQELVQLIVSKSSIDQPNEFLIQQQQLVTADLTSIIIQLISTAGSLLPAVKHPNFSSNPNPNPNPNPSAGNGVGSLPQHNNSDDNHDSDGNSHGNMVSKMEDQSHETDHMDVHEEHDDDIDEGENLPPGSYEILQLEKEEILAPHTHFCVICGKGFKRDANLRMHMRGHGDEYKTAAALAKPHKDPVTEVKLIKRYSCPYVGCKRNKDHKKFQPLKTILCVKNHYKRTHCDKSYTCSRCNTKKFSVIADLKTHEKHCGRDRWICSCGTTFSRKDKLFGHIALFQGHTPAIPIEESKGGAPVGGHNHDHGDNYNNNNIEGSKEVGFFDFNFNSNGSASDPNVCFSPMNMESCNVNRFQDFPRTLFEDSDNFSLLLPGSCNYLWKNGGESSSKDLQ
ncbi:hypothetical protein L1887_20737 [Cichorium endivia]|nr:hypothetical protein L1887_20737 [Cichorium endivia]